MPHPRILDIDKAALLVIDIQEAFRNVITGFSEMSARTSVAIRGFEILERPIFVTEQYPQGLGRTVEELLFGLPQDALIFDKTSFSGCGATGFVNGLNAAAVEHVAVCGLETHVCVNQTVHDLLDRGFSVHILTDCVGSRSDNDRAAGLLKMEGSGAIPSSVEMALFEMTAGSGHKHFKQIQALIK
jgi:nicotinamidase-related amidase